MFTLLVLGEADNIPIFIEIESDLFVILFYYFTGEIYRTEITIQTHFPGKFTRSVNPVQFILLRVY